MTLVDPDQFADGTTHTAAQHNSPNNEMAAAINGGLSNENIQALAGIVGSKLADGNDGMFGAWDDYTPTITGSTTSPTLGNSTLVAQYKQIGKTMVVRIRLTIGSTFSVGSGAYRFTLPVTASTDYTSSAASLGAHGVVFDNSASEVGAIIGSKFLTTTTEFYATKQSAYGTLGHAFPFAWAQDDTIDLTMLYQAN